jgi:glucose-6-phosphate dehydrogenase assembly protein OpcA
MSDRSEITDGMAVDVGRIERELSELWRAAAEASESGEMTPITRACLVNLVAWAPPGAPALRFKQLGDRLSLTVPARILHVRPERDGRGAGVEAWISANCHLAPEGGKEICSEEVTLAGRGGGVDELPSVVLSLLAPDVPTAVLVGGELPRGAALDPALARVVAAGDRLIVDSGYDRGADALGGLRSLSRALPANGSAGDLAWRRMAPWRMAVADEFDRALAGRAADVERAEIDVTGGGGDSAEGSARVVTLAAARTSGGGGGVLLAGTSGGGLSEGLLLAGWVASRLGWRVTSARSEASAPQPSGGGERGERRANGSPAAAVSARFDSRGGQVEAHIEVRAGAGGDAGGVGGASIARSAARVSGLRLHLRASGTGPARALRITSLPDERDVVMGIDSEGDTARIARMIRRPDEQLLARELRFIAGDPMFHAAFEAASAIAEAARL